MSVWSVPVGISGSHMHPIKLKFKREDPKLGGMETVDLGGVRRKSGRGRICSKHIVYAHEILRT